MVNKNAILVSACSLQIEKQSRNCIVIVNLQVTVSKFKNSCLRPCEENWFFIDIPLILLLIQAT